MPRETIEQKAKRYIDEGRTVLKYVRHDSLTGFVESAVVLVQGSGNKPYYVMFNGQWWMCNCPAHVDRCAHIVSGQLLLRARPEAQPDAPGPPPLFTSEELDRLLGS